MNQKPLVMNPEFAGILYAFAAWMTVQPDELCFGAQHEAPIAVDAINAFATMHGFAIEQAAIGGWKKAASPQGAVPIIES